MCSSFGSHADLKLEGLVPISLARMEECGFLIMTTPSLLVAPSFDQSAACAQMGKHWY